MRRAGLGWLVALFAIAFALTWVLRAGSGREAPATASPAAAQPAATTLPTLSSAKVPPIEAADPPPAAVATPGAAPPDHALPAPIADPELERAAAALAAEPALIDALQDSASHPDPLVRAEAEALVEAALARARARAATPVPAAASAADVTPADETP